MNSIFRTSMKSVDWAIYIRVSSDKQVKEGNGLEVQQKKCEAMALIKRWNVVGVFSDEGISGTVIPVKRPGLKKLLAEIESGKIKGVIIYSLDRLGRTVKIITETIQYIQLLGCDVFSFKETLDTSTPQGKLFINFMSAMSDFDRENMLKRLSDGRKIRQLKDGEIGGVVIYGYRRVNDKIDIHEYNAEIVRYIFEARECNMSLRNISEKLNDKNIPSPRFKKWTVNSVHGILNHKDKYLGGKRNNSDFSWPIILPSKYKNIKFINKKSKKIKTSEEIKLEKLEAGKKKLDMTLFKE